MTESHSLVPEDWTAFRRDAHAALDAALDHMQGRADRPVWRPVPDAVKAALEAPAPPGPAETGALVSDVMEKIAAYDIGNTHPRFYGWVHGAGTPEGVIPAMLEAAINANMGGREHAAVYAERQLIGWMREVFGFPESGGGLTVSGTSMATILAMKAALLNHGGEAVRDLGVMALPRPVAVYASAEAHSCITRAYEILGVGRKAVRRVPVDANFRMDLNALAAMIAADRAAGYAPIALVGTAGTVNQGAVDPLEALADIAAAEGLWLHVDGAFGAMAQLSPELAPIVSGIEHADSLAFDFHKWLHVTYDAGMILMRDAELLRAAFSERPDYLAASERGLAAGNPWFTEYGPELSRGFRALRVWYQIKRFGLDRLGEAIAANCRLARHLTERVGAEKRLELMAPATLNVTCFRYRVPDPAESERVNAEIVVLLQERGLAAPSTTRIGGEMAIRVNLTNHRTTTEDMDALVADVIAIGDELTALATAG